MKKSLYVAMLSAMLCAVPFRSQAHEYDTDDSEHPLRVIAYALHPVGIAAEYLIFRPIHCLVSYNETTAWLFGHETEGKYCCEEHCKKAAAEVAAAKTEAAGAPESKTPVERPGSSVSVTTAPPASAEAEHPQIKGAELSKEMMIVYFDFDRFNIRGDQVARIDKDLQYLKDHADLKIIVEGHCDERGTNEYNMALGERRAKAVSEYLTKNGIDPGRIVTISKGEEEPADPGHTEEAWAKNRRAEFKKQTQ